MDGVVRGKVEEGRGGKPAHWESLAAAAVMDLPDGGDQAPVGGDVRRPRRRARTVHDGTAPDDQVMTHDFPPKSNALQRET